MISRKATEEDLRIMFSPYGTIEELTILRDSDGKSRGLWYMLFVIFFFAGGWTNCFKTGWKDVT